MGLTAIAVAVGTSATQLYGTAIPANAKRLTIVNGGPNAIHIGPTNAVTTANGFRIPAGSTFPLQAGVHLNGAIWAIAETAAQVSPADTRVLVETSD